MWDVVYLPEAESERLVLPKVERNALIHAVEKLAAFGPQLGYPHTSAVQGFTGLRELRPRAGRSPWRALYGYERDTAERDRRALGDPDTPAEDSRRSGRASPGS